LYRCRQCIAEVPLVGVTCNSGSDVGSHGSAGATLGSDAAVLAFTLGSGVRRGVSTMEASWVGADDGAPTESRKYDEQDLARCLVLSSSFACAGACRQLQDDRLIDWDKARKGPWSTRHRSSSSCWPDSVDGCDQSIDRWGPWGPARQEERRSLSHPLVGPKDYVHRSKDVIDDLCNIMRAMASVDSEVQ
jgi:hypothetical protein